MELEVKEKMGLRDAMYVEERPSKAFKQTLIGSVITTSVCGNCMDR